jgi:hypothetical protein
MKTGLKEFSILSTGTIHTQQENKGEATVLNQTLRHEDVRYWRLEV